MVPLAFFASVFLNTVRQAGQKTHHSLPCVLVVGATIPYVNLSVIRVVTFIIKVLTALHHSG